MNQQKINPNSKKKLFVWAWILGLIFYFIDYATRSAPSLMIPNLSELYSISKTETIGLIGSYYYTYAICGLVAGILLDKLGARFSMFAGCFILGLGCILFIVSSQFSGEIGRLLQGAGSAFAFPGCVYLITKGFSEKYLATAIGFTQCIGMLGGSAGQFVVAPLLENGLSYINFWIISGVLCILPAIAFLIITPKQTQEEAIKGKETPIIRPFKIIFSNKNSWLCGLISGLLFIPTTIFAMTWAVPYLKLDLGFEPTDAAITAAMAALGWVVGSPLMGYITDKIGKRKPIIILGCLGMIAMLFVLMYANDTINPKISLFIFGVFSGVAMIPYSVIKEVNPDYVKGSATGVQNFLTFGVTSIFSIVFANLFGNNIYNVIDKTAHFQQSILFWIVGIFIAIVLTLFLKETGSKAIKN